MTELVDQVSAIDSTSGDGPKYAEELQSLREAADVLLHRVQGGDDARWREILAWNRCGASWQRSADRLRTLDPADVQMEHAQQAIALSYGFASWAQMERILRRICRGGLHYFVEEAWGHIFSDGVERGVRFAYDRDLRKICAMQILYAYRHRDRSTGEWTYHNEWVRASWEAIEDVAASLGHNDVPEMIETAAKWNFPSFAHPRQLTHRLPRWA
jgi:hypothetical protein